MREVYHGVIAWPGRLARRACSMGNHLRDKESVRNISFWAHVRWGERGLLVISSM